jgi:hypothetical protein
MVSKLCFTLIVTAVGGWCQSAERIVAVSFLVKNEAGNALAGWQVKSFKAGSRELASQFVGLTGTKIPAGFYQYVLTGPPVSRPDWIPTLGGKVEAYRAEKFVVRTATMEDLSGVAIDDALPASFVIMGRIEPAPPTDNAGEPLRVNIPSLEPLVRRGCQSGRGWQVPHL